MKNSMLLVVIATLIGLNACKKDEGTSGSKDYTLEMKVNGTLWTAEKNQAGSYIPSRKSISLTGQKGDEIILLNRDSITSTGTYNMPSGSITVHYIKNGALKIYTLSSSKPKSHGSVTLLSLTNSPLPDGQYPEANFDGVLYDSFNADSIVVTEGKLRYQ